MSGLNPSSAGRVGIIGGGSFGSALADIIGTRGHPVSLWFRNAEAAADFNATHQNRKYLPGLTLSSLITATADLEEASRDCDLVLVCVPSPYFRDTAKRLGAWMRADQMIVSTTKGIETGTFRLMTEILAEEVACRRIGALSGPNLAKEIAARKISGTVIASEHADLIATVQELLSCSYFRVYSNPDVRGVELGGVLKNVYAIATGLATARDLGDNARGMIMTRALAEMSRFAACWGADPLTFLGLAGVGDLVTTCTSPLSRNFRVGHLIGEGKSLEEAVHAIGEVAEGVHTVRVVYEKLADLGIRMHILEGLHALLFEKVPLDTVLKELMNVPQMEDVEFGRRP